MFVAAKLNIQAAKLVLTKAKKILPVAALKLSNQQVEESCCQQPETLCNEIMVMNPENLQVFLQVFVFDYGHPGLSKSKTKKKCNFLIYCWQ